MKRIAAVCMLAAWGFSGCTVAETVHGLDMDCPSPQLGRPSFVRGPARLGAWIGGGAGAIVALGLWPITKPLGLLASDSLGYSEEEFTYMPVTIGASTGHFILGAPADFFYFLFYGAWVEEVPEKGFEFEPMQTPKSPRTDLRPGRGQGAKKAERAEKAEKGEKGEKGEAGKEGKKGL